MFQFQEPPESLRSARPGESTQKHHRIFTGAYKISNSSSSGKKGLDRSKKHPSRHKEGSKTRAKSYGFPPIWKFTPTNLLERESDPRKVPLSWRVDASATSTFNFILANSQRMSPAHLLRSVDLPLFFYAWQAQTQAHTHHSFPPLVFSHIDHRTKRSQVYFFDRLGRKKSQLFKGSEVQQRANRRSDHDQGV